METQQIQGTHHVLQDRLASLFPVQKNCHFMNSSCLIYGHIKINQPIILGKSRYRKTQIKAHGRLQALWAERGQFPLSPAFYGMKSDHYQQRYSQKREKTPQYGV